MDDRRFIIACATVPFAVSSPDIVRYADRGFRTSLTILTAMIATAALVTASGYLCVVAHTTIRGAVSINPLAWLAARYQPVVFVAGCIWLILCAFAYTGVAIAIPVYKPCVRYGPTDSAIRVHPGYGRSRVSWQDPLCGG